MHLCVASSSLEWTAASFERRAAARKPYRLDRRGAPPGMLRSHEPGTVRAGFGSRSRFPRPREACPNGLRPRWQQISSRHKLTERSSRRLCSLTITTGGCTGDARTAPYVCADLPPAANVAAARLHRLLLAEEISNATQNRRGRCLVHANEAFHAARRCRSGQSHFKRAGASLDIYYIMESDVKFARSVTARLLINYIGKIDL